VSPSIFRGIRRKRSNTACWMHERAGWSFSAGSPSELTPGGPRRTGRPEKRPRLRLTTCFNFHLCFRPFVENLARQILSVISALSKSQPVGFTSVWFENLDEKVQQQRLHSAIRH
jgi:hypothetical protein